MIRPLPAMRNRYEMKYLIDVAQYRALVTELKTYMTPDPMAADADGRYQVSSLYYDSPDLAAYRSKIDGLKYRRKLRIRVYPKAAPGWHPEVAHVEIKQRINRTVQKRRVALSPEGALALCAGQAPADRPGDERVAAVVDEVRYLVRAQTLRPTALVHYRRQAFFGGRWDPGLRLTFDTQLRGRTAQLTLEPSPDDALVLPRDRVIMEVKFNDRVPGWMVSLLGRHDCCAQRMSKYCRVVEATADQGRRVAAR